MRETSIFFIAHSGGHRSTSRPRLFQCIGCGAEVELEAELQRAGDVFPNASGGFAGQVSTWNGAYALNGKGPAPGEAALMLIHSNGAMKQQGGRYMTADQKTNILFDPRIKMPVFVDELITFVPRLSINSYTVEMKLIRD